MITQAIEVLDAAASGLPVAKRNGLAEQVQRGDSIIPAVYVGGGDLVNVATDLSGTWSYWRQTSKVTTTPQAAFTADRVERHTVTLRLVALLDRANEVCGNIPGVLQSVSSSLAGSYKALQTALSAYRVQVRATDLNSNSDEVYREELARAGVGRVPTNRALIAIDVRLEVDAKVGCLPGCGEIIPVTPGTPCEIIAARTWPQVKGCMTEGQIDAAIADLCDGGSCPVDVEIRFNGVLVQTLNDLDPCEAQTINIS